MSLSGASTNDIVDGFMDDGYDYIEAKEIFDAMVQNPNMFSYTRDEVVDYIETTKEEAEIWRKVLEGEEESEEDDFDIPSYDEVYSTNVGKPKIFKIGCDYKGVKVIVEEDKERVYIPSSEYCFIKCINKYLSLIGQKVRIGTKYLNPYGDSLKKLKDVACGAVIKCTCGNSKKGDGYIGQNCTDSCKKEKDDYYKLLMPEIYKVYYSKEKSRVEVQILTKSASKRNPEIAKIYDYGIGICHLGGNEYHAILLKGVSNKRQYIKEDITFKLTMDRKLNCEFVRCKKAEIPINKHRICVSYDIETYTEEGVDKKGKKIKKLIPFALGYEVIDLFKLEVISEYKEVIISNKEENLFNKFFDELDKDPLVPSDAQIYAHNGGRFDNKYAKDFATNVTFNKIISKGSFIKQLSLTTESGKTLKMKDSLPFVLQPLKDACKTFNTSIVKLDFDIVDKSYEWYVEYMDSKDEKTDWRKYLENDVKSLSQVIFGAEKAFSKFGVSMFWFTGLPGIAYHMLNTYCLGMEKLYVPKDPSAVKFIKEAYYGGRVIQWKRFYEDKDEKGMISIDMNSLYPSAMYAGSFPIGEPKMFNSENIKNYSKYPHYIVEAEIEIPNIRYAYHPYRSDDGLLIYPSNKTIVGVYNDVDLKEMVKDGYKIKKVNKGIYWVQSQRIFSNFIEQLYNERNRYKKLGSSHPEYFMEYVLKVVLTSAYGKFSETVKSKSLFKDLDYNQDISNQGKVEAETILANGQKQIDISLARYNVSKPTYIAGYVTAYSRAIVNEIFREINPENIYYSDTDSVYVEKRILDEKNLNCTSALCGFKNDYGENMVITKAIFLDMKRYFLILEDRSDPKNIKKFYKAKFNGLAFKSLKGIDNIIYEQHLDFPNTSAESKMEQVEKMYMNYLDQHNARLASKYYDVPDKEARRMQREWEAENIKEMKLYTEFWNRNNKGVYIETKEMLFRIDPHRRGTWENGEFYSIGYDNKKRDETINHISGKIGEVERICSKRPILSYTEHIKKADGKFSYLEMDGNDKVEEIESYNLKCRRPLIFNENTKINALKDKNYIVHGNAERVRTTLWYGVKIIEENGFVVKKEDVLYLDDKEKVVINGEEKLKGYVINAFGKMNPFLYKNVDELDYTDILPLIAVKGTNENILKYGANYVPEREIIKLLKNIDNNVKFTIKKYQPIYLTGMFFQNSKTYTFTYFTHIPDDPAYIHATNLVKSWEEEKSPDYVIVKYLIEFLEKYKFRGKRIESYIKKLEVKKYGAPGTKIDCQCAFMYQAMELSRVELCTDIYNRSGRVNMDTEKYESISRFTCPVTGNKMKQIQSNIDKGKDKIKGSLSDCVVCITFTSYNYYFVSKIGYDIKDKTDEFTLVQSMINRNPKLMDFFKKMNGMYGNYYVYYGEVDIDSLNNYLPVDRLINV